MTDWTTPETRIVATWIQNDDWAYTSSRHAAHHGRLREYIAAVLCHDAGSLFAAAMITTALDAVDWADLAERFETDDDERCRHAS